MKSEEVNKKEFELGEEELDNVTGGNVFDMIKLYLKSRIGCGK